MGRRPPRPRRPPPTARGAIASRQPQAWAPDRSTGCASCSPDNPLYVTRWQTASITAYTSGSTVPGGDFDIANVILLSPPPDAATALPVTFTWQPRGIPGDTYRLAFFDMATDDYWYTADLGNVGSYTATGLWQGAVYGKEYGWVVWVFNGPDSFGESYYIRAITFLAGAAGSPATPGQWQIGEEPRE